MLLGWVLCAVKGGCLRTLPTSTSGPSSRLKRSHWEAHSRFMKRGPCSQYSGVVHQYEYAPLGAAIELSDRSPRCARPIRPPQARRFCFRDARSTDDTASEQRSTL